MTYTFEVKVLPRVDHSDRSETQLQKGDRLWEGSVERSRRPTNRNWIEGVADQGERAKDRKALMVKDQAA